MPLIAGIRIGEQAADIAFAGGPEQRVDHGVDDRVAVGMARAGPWREGIRRPPRIKRPARPSADEGHTPVRFSCRIASAVIKSRESVILMFRGIAGDDGHRPPQALNERRLVGSRNSGLRGRGQGPPEERHRRSPAASGRGPRGPGRASGRRGRRRFPSGCHRKERRARPPRSSPRPSSTRSIRSAETSGRAPS